MSDATTKQPLVSIIIPHQAGTEILSRCLETIHRDASYPHYETILVDNGSCDGSVATAKDRFPDIQVLRLEANQGYAGGCNRGIEASSGEYVVLLNDDTELEPGWLGELVRAVEEDLSVGACQPKIRSLRDKSRFEYSGGAGGLLDMYGYPFSRGRLMGHVETDHGQYDDPAEVFWASGVCMLLRRSSLERSGLLDEVFFAYMEEIDLCWRLHLQGFRVVYVPTAIVYHIGGYSLDQRMLKRMYLNHRNSVIMLLKNYSARSLSWILPVKVFLELFIMTGAIVQNPRRSLAVMMSFGWLATHLGTVLGLRAEVQRQRRVPDGEIFSRLYYGMAPLWYFLFGIRRITDLPDIDLVLHQPYRRDQKPPEGQTIQPERRNFLHAYLDQAPTGLALMRAVECDHIARLPFERPILDAGCGDGMFARMLFNGVIVDAAVDADSEKADRARKTRCYAEVREAGIEALPFESGRMATVLCNGVLSRVSDLDAVLREIHRVLKPGGRFYLTVPTPDCIAFLLWPGLLTRLRLERLARAYESSMLRLFRAENVLDADEWQEQLEQAGFAVEERETYMPRRAARLQDLFLPTSVVWTAWNRLLGRHLLFPRLHRLRVRLYRRLLRSAFEERSPEGSGLLLVARKPGPDPSTGPSPRLE